MDLREQRAFEMLDNGKIPQLVDKETFIVPSQTSNKKYTVKTRVIGFAIVLTSDVDIKFVNIS